MGYLSCKAHDSVVICDPHFYAVRPDQPAGDNTLNKTKKKKKDGVVSAEPSPFVNNLKHFNYSDLEAATNGFSSQKLLGRGSHGSVYRAVHNGRLVAVKKSSKPSSGGGGGGAASASTPARIEADNEIDILSRIQSPRLVNLLGFTNGGDDRLLVVEFMKNGTLFDILHSNPNPPGWGRRLRLALQTAKAVHILHSCDPPVIHRDIKSANVLIDRHFNARLGDFGLALRCGHASQFRSTPPAGTLGYLDPCYVTPDNLSPKTDVFSFGILLLEIVSGRKAIDVAHSPPYILDWAAPLIKKGKASTIYDPRVSPPKDSFTRKQIAMVAARCVRSSKELRPSMKEVVDCLAELTESSPLQLQRLLNINNPCIAVDDVGRPSKLVVRPMRSSGGRNLMDLMKDDEEREAGIGFPLFGSRRRGSSSRWSRTRPLDQDCNVELGLDDAVGMQN